jgi:hypothetical protein
MCLDEIQRMRAGSTDGCTHWTLHKALALSMVFAIGSIGGNYGSAIYWDVFHLSQLSCIFPCARSAYLVSSYGHLEIFITCSSCYINPKQHLLLGWGPMGSVTICGWFWDHMCQKTSWFIIILVASFPTISIGYKIVSHHTTPHHITSHTHICI